MIRDEIALSKVVAVRQHVESALHVGSSTYPSFLLSRALALSSIAGFIMKKESK